MRDAALLALCGLCLGSANGELTPLKHCFCELPVWDSPHLLFPRIVRQPVIQAEGKVNKMNPLLFYQLFKMLNKTNILVLAFIFIIICILGVFAENDAAFNATPSHPPRFIITNL